MSVRRNGSRWLLRCGVQRFECGIKVSYKAAKPPLYEQWGLAYTWLDLCLNGAESMSFIRGSVPVNRRGCGAIRTNEGEGILW